MMIFEISQERVISSSKKVAALSENLLSIESPFSFQMASANGKAEKSHNRSLWSRIFRFSSSYKKSGPGNPGLRQKVKLRSVLVSSYLFLRIHGSGVTKAADRRSKPIHTPGLSYKSSAKQAISTLWFPCTPPPAYSYIAWQKHRIPAMKRQRPACTSGRR